MVFIYTELVTYLGCSRFVYLIFIIGLGLDSLKFYLNLQNWWSQAVCIIFILFIYLHIYAHVEYE